MNTIAQIATAMQTVLTTEAARLGRKVGFVQRTGKLGGSTFVQTLVFGFMDNPEATVEDLSQTATVVGVGISPIGTQPFQSRASGSKVHHGDCPGTDPA